MMEMPGLVGLALCLWTSVASIAQEPATSVRVQGRLAPGQTETRDLATNQSDDWLIQTTAGDFVVIALEHLTVDVDVLVESPSGDVLRRVNHSGFSGTQIVRWISGTDTGTWRVRIAVAARDASGTYRIALRAVRASSERDRLIVEADEIVERAQTVRPDDPAAAEDLLRKAIDTTARASGPDSADVSGVLHVLADVLHEAGRYGEAVTLLARALRIDQDTFGVDSVEASIALNNLGYMYQMHGRYRDAEPLLARALEVRGAVFGWDHPRTGITLDNLAIVYLSLGRYAEAENHANRALRIFEKALGHDHHYVSYPLNILASAAALTGRYEAADPLLRRALHIDAQRLGTTHVNYAVALSKVAQNEAHRGRLEEAERLFSEVLAIHKGQLAEDHPYIALALWHLARLHRLAGRHDRALELLAQCLSIEQRALGSNHPSTAQTLLETVRTRTAAGDRNLAEIQQLADRAIEILESAGAGPKTLADAYALRADLHERRNERQQAIDDLAEAIRLIEELRPQLGGAEDARAEFFQHYAAYFDRMTLWLAEAGSWERAFEYAERGVGRALLDQLAAGNVDIRNAIAEDVRLDLERQEGQIKTRLAEIASHLARLRSDGEAGTESRRQAILAAEQELRQAETDYEHVYAEFRNQSPAWRDHSVSGGRTVSLATTRRDLVPRDGLLLLYQVGSSNSQVLVIPPAGGAPPSLLALRVDEQAAVDLGISAGNLTLSSLATALTGSDDRSSAGVLPALAARSGSGLGIGLPRSREAALGALWRTLIPEPIRGSVLRATEVVIVPDGPLHGLPFDALIVSAGGTGPRYWLDVGPILRYAPSATVLWRLTARPVTALPDDGAYVLSVSDPVFSAPSPAAREEPGLSAQPLVRSSYEQAGGSLARLPGTARETDAIRRAYGGEAERVVIALQGAAATEPSVRASLEGKRYVHLATHALAAGDDRALFASLVLTQPPSPVTGTEADGFLQLHEIYELELRGLELAVLSACDTNRGRNIDGEGVFALARGFLTAGATRVVASQWQVDDASTAAIMGLMFNQIVADQREGRRLDVAAALRDAKRAVRQREEWSAPFHWAPFVITGVR